MFYENLIIPFPICDENRCYYFSKNGFGNETGFYDSGRCTYIVENEYYCNFKKKEIMFCAEYKHDCEIVKSTMTFHDPLVLNDTHTLLFTKNPTIIKNDLFIEKLDLLTNYIVSFNLNTKFFIIAGIAVFSLASLIIIFTTILAVKKCKKQNKNTAIRINRSRIYYSAFRQQTSSL